MTRQSDAGAFIVQSDKGINAAKNGCEPWTLKPRERFNSPQKSADFTFQNWPSLLYLLWVHVVPALLVGPGEREEASVKFRSCLPASQSGAAARSANRGVRSGFHFLSPWPAGKWIASTLRRSFFILFILRLAWKWRKPEQKVLMQINR